MEEEEEEEERGGRRERGSPAFKLDEHRGLEHRKRNREKEEIPPFATFFHAASSSYLSSFCDFAFFFCNVARDEQIRSKSQVAGHRAFVRFGDGGLDVDLRRLLRESRIKIARVTRMSVIREECNL